MQGHVLTVCRHHNLGGCGRELLPFTHLIGTDLAVPLCKLGTLQVQASRVAAMNPL